LFILLTGNTKASPFILEIQKRQWLLPKTTHSVAWLQFEDVCKDARGAEDYLALAQTFKIIFISNIPQFTSEDINEAKRFIMLIDILYDQKIHLIVSAEVAPSQLYLKGPHSSIFKRTISRLIEMTGSSKLP
jgi:cell division protein ZapE